MTLIQTSLIWVVYAIVAALLVLLSVVFIYNFQSPRERSVIITILCILTTTALLATILLIPVDIALVSSTNQAKSGTKKDWATPDKVESIVYTLQVVYYTLYSVDALLCLLIIPFAYFWYEESEDDSGEVAERSLGSRLWAASRYTLVFLVLVIVLFLVGFFLPIAKDAKRREHLDLDYFKRLLQENAGEKALTFAVGLLITVGTLLYVLYTASGLALLPIAMIRSIPSISGPTLAADTASQLEINRERQRQLERQNEGREGGLDTRDQRELEALVREERTLTRRERLAAETTAENRAWPVRILKKFGAILRPFRLIGGVLLAAFTLLIWASMLITGVDKAKNSVCKAHCGYLLGHIQIFQPINWIFVRSSRVFPVDYIISFLLVTLLFCASVYGIATAGIRFLWVIIFRIRKGHTAPQALLMATVMLALIILALNYSIAMVIAPQYATFGAQTYCDRPARHADEQPNCANHTSSIKQCTELAENPAAKEICTPTVVSTFINRITLNFPFFGLVDFWAQFAFLGVYLVVFILSLFRTPKVGMSELDADLEEEEDEGLLASTGRRLNASWQDITGRTRAKSRNYGTTERGSSSNDSA